MTYQYSRIPSSQSYDVSTRDNIRTRFLQFRFYLVDDLKPTSRIPVRVRPLLTDQAPSAIQK